MHKQRNNLTYYDDTKKMAHDSQVVRANENLKLNHGGPSQRPASGTNPPMKNLGQALHWVWHLSHRHAIQDESIA